jgi:hypothetical protein
MLIVLSLNVGIHAVAKDAMPEEVSETFALLSGYEPGAAGIAHLAHQVSDVVPFIVRFVHALARNPLCER